MRRERLRVGSRRAVRRAGHCLLHNASLFVGLTAVPLGSRPGFTRAVKTFFRRYREELEEKLCLERSEAEAWARSPLYRPYTLHLLGTFDIGILALVDNFEFGTKFHSSRPEFFSADDPDPEKDRAWAATERSLLGFTHKTILGPMPNVDGPDATPESLVSHYLGTVNGANEEPRPWPLVGVCQLKLDNGLLLGTGADHVRCVLWAVKALEQQDTTNPLSNGRRRVETLVLESYSWNELTLLLFSDSFQAILDFVLRVRELNVGDIVHALRATHAQDLRYFCADRSVRRAFFEEQNRAWQGAGRDDLHVFWNSTTTLGFRTELTEGRAEELQAPSQEDGMMLLDNWQARAGHLGSSRDAVCRALGRDPAAEPVLATCGHGDFVLVLPEPGSKALVCSAEVVSFMRRGIFPVLAEKRHGLSSSVAVVIPTPAERFRPVRDDHYFAHLDLMQHLRNRGRLKDQRTLGRVREDLRRARTGQVVSERVLNALALYNQGITDPFFLNHFLTLTPLVDALARVAAEQAQTADSTSETIRERSERLGNLVNFFDRAWRNRYFGGRPNEDAGDVNIDFKSGVQQLVTAYDGAYKTMARSLLAPDELLPVVVVAGNTALHSTVYTLELSYFDIFHPEFFAARAFHELAENFLTRELARGFHPSDPECGPGQLTALTGWWPFCRTRAAVAPTGAAGFWAAIQRFPDIARHLARDAWADCLTFYYTYLADVDLFLHWYRNMFNAETSAWRPSGQPDPLALRYWLVRQVLVLEAATAWGELVWPHRQGTAELLVRLYAEAGADRPEVRAVLARARDVITTGSGAVAGDEIADLARILRNAVEFARERFGSRLDRLRRGSRIFGNRLGLGIPPVVGRSLGRAEPFAGPDYLRVLGHAFLTLLWRRTWRPGQSTLLRRTTDGRADLTAGPGLAQLLFDPRGGTFTWQTGIRRDYFKWRCAFTMGLWDSTIRAEYGDLADRAEGGP